MDIHGVLAEAGGHRKSQDLLPLQQHQAIHSQLFRVCQGPKQRQLLQMVIPVRVCCLPAQIPGGGHILHRFQIRRLIIIARFFTKGNNLYMLKPFYRLHGVGIVTVHHDPTAGLKPILMEMANGILHGPEILQMIIVDI